jgi:hypothetical protein
MSFWQLTNRLNMAYMTGPFHLGGRWRDRYSQTGEECIEPLGYRVVHSLQGPHQRLQCCDSTGADGWIAILQGGQQWLYSSHVTAVPKRLEGLETYVWRSRGGVVKEAVEVIRLAWGMPHAEQEKSDDDSHHTHNLVLLKTTGDRLVLRTAIAAPVWRGRTYCFSIQFGGKNWIQTATELY